MRGICTSGSMSGRWKRSIMCNRATSRLYIVSLSAAGPDFARCAPGPGHPRCGPAVRAGLYMATIAAMRFNAVIRPFGERLIAAGKAFKVAMIACMRKLVTILNVMVKNNEHWRVPVLQHA